MSKVVLKRSLFIGLGGTGAMALLHTKKRFLDTYGEIPPMIDFLVIDTDQNTSTKFLERENVLPEIHKNSDQQVRFKNSEILYTKVRGAKQAYQKNKNTLFNWMPTENEHVLKDMVHGAGQVRTNGRYSIYFNQSAIIEAVRNKIGSITNITIGDHDRFEAKGSGIEINFVFSLAGGTGSGSFIDVAYLVKDALAGNDEIVTVGFLVLPDVFNAMQGGVSMENTNPNTFGALSDLDYLMQNQIERMGLNITFSTRQINIDSNPFDILFTVNNKNTSGETIKDVSEISEQIGLAMFTGASELSANVGSVYDNVKSVLLGGNLDIEDKRAWACGMGVSELYYDGNTLGNIYARRVTQMMIDDLLNTTDEAQKLANVFIDDPAVNIRENEGNDYLIDSLLSPTPNTQFSGLDDPSDAKNEIQAFLKNVETNAETAIQTNYENRLNNVKRNLEEEISRIINKYGGVGNVKAFLTDLENQLGIFNNEMKEEEQSFKQSSQNLGQSIDSNVSELQNSTGFFAIFKSSEKKELKNSISDYVNQQATTSHEILRRRFAQNFFNSLLREIVDHLENIEKIEHLLEDVKNEARNKANNLANATSDRNKIFVIDLHKEDLGKAYASEDDYILSNFAQTLNLASGIYDFHQSAPKVVSDYFWNYSRKLPKAIAFRNVSIEEVLRNYPEEKKKEIAKKLLNKSKALWQWSSHGYKIDHEISENFVIGLPSKDSDFAKSFEGLTEAGQTRMNFVNTGVNNRITCYRMESAVPIFGVQGLTEYENDYKNKRRRPNALNYNIDNNWFTDMQRSNFSIWPKVREDKSLSIWIFGLVYGFIRLNEESKEYEVYSLKKGNALDDYWFPLSNYRDKAFDIFKNQDFAPEVEELIEKKQQEHGKIRTEEIVNLVKEDYRNRYAQMNLSNDELKQPHFKKTADLLTSEIDFTKKEL